MFQGRHATFSFLSEARLGRPGVVPEISLVLVLFLTTRYSRLPLVIFRRSCCNLRSDLDLQLFVAIYC